MGLKLKIPKEIDTGLCNNCVHLRKVFFDNNDMRVLCNNLHVELHRKVTACSFFHLGIDEESNKSIPFHLAWDVYVDDDSGDMKFYNPRVRNNKIKGMR